MTTILEDFTIHPRAKAPKYRPIGPTLGEVYKSCSHKKQVAYDYCVRLCKKYDGEQFAITGKTIVAFLSCSFSRTRKTGGECWHISPVIIITLIISTMTITRRVRRCYK